MSQQSRLSSRFVAVLGALALAASVLVSPTLATAAPGEDGRGHADGRGQGKDVPVSESGSYIVLMEGQPLAATDGQQAVTTRRGRAQGRALQAQHRRAAESVDAEIVNEYTVALNGFSTIISHAKATKLAARDDVLLVLPDELRQPLTDASPEFLGLTGPGGAHTTGVTGEGVVVGIIDTGIWPEHPSFADTGYPEPPISPLEPVVVEGDPETDADDYHIGTCEFGNAEHNPADADFECNNKLVGARQMLATYRTLIGATPEEFDSARDDNGHGTHTASTTAGNAGVEAVIGPHELGEVSGIAPRAHIIAYKGLGALGGFTSDLAAAIDQAVADGVDVINYSIGGGASLTTADALAFLFAADAGVHAAVSAGNSGPAPGTIGGPASVPWVTTVGASSQPRFFQGTVVLGNGERVVGASLTPAMAGEQVPLVDAAHPSVTKGKNKNKTPKDLCVPGTLNRGVVRGAIVLCRRGVIARAAKSQAVLQAGGVGMILYNNRDDANRFTDNHVVPSVHVDNTPGLAIKDYIASLDLMEATATIVDTGTKATLDFAPAVTSFSSRGPDPVALDIIKPDVTAPGLQILAGASPYADPNGYSFQAIAGTSMSSPHVAGLLALLEDVHPDWSPAMAKSALMTSASQDVRDNDRTSPADPFDMGAGHVDPGSPGAPGTSFQPPG